MLWKNEYYVLEYRYGIYVGKSTGHIFMFKF